MNLFNYTYITLEPVYDSGTKVYSRGDIAVIEKDLPGVKKSDVSVELDGRQLKISWSRKDSNRLSTYYDVPTGVTQTAARLEDGVLTVELTCPSTKKVIPIE